MKKLVIIPMALFAIATLASAQMNMSHDKSTRPSPPASAECKFSDGKTVKIDYSSPRAKGRKIFGDAGDKALVPFGEVWRTGANEATTFVSTANIKLGGNIFPGGSYTLFTIPKADAWTLIISKKTGEWGTDYPGEKEDLDRLRSGRQQMHPPHRMGKHHRQNRYRRKVALAAAGASSPPPRIHPPVRENPRKSTGKKFSQKLERLMCSDARPLSLPSPSYTTLPRDPHHCPAPAQSPSLI
jgi:hypothetical protein